MRGRDKRLGYQGIGLGLDRYGFGERSAHVYAQAQLSGLPGHVFISARLAGAFGTAIRPRCFHHMITPPTAYTHASDTCARVVSRVGWMPVKSASARGKRGITPSSNVALIRPDS